MRVTFSLRNYGLLSFFLASTAWGNLANHTLWLEHGGGVKGTGSNEYGQLSMDVLRQSENPISSKFGVREVAAGVYHTVYLMWDGTVFAAGRNGSGQFGDGTTTNRTNPVQAMNADGTVLSGVVGISAGEYHTVYLKSDGSVWATGSNTYGQLGDGTTTQRTNPAQVKNADGTGLSGVVGISAGNTHTVYLKSDGSVWATGSNTYGQLGDGTTTQRTHPVQAMNADGTVLSGVVGISAGNTHTVYLKSDGTVWATGSNYYGQLGDGTTTQRTNPVQVMNADGTGLSGVMGISVGYLHTVYLKSDGTVWATGQNSLGQLGDGTTTHRSNPVLVKNADGTGLSEVLAIAAGSSHTVYLKSDWSVWATGRNHYGQLGDGTTTQRTNPAQVKNADGTGLSGVEGVSAAKYQTVYLKSDGSVWAAGSNTYGQLGDGTTTQRTNPVQVLRDPQISGGLDNIIATASYHQHTIYLKSDGTVWAAGWNGNGQLGDGTTTDRSNPVQVTNADGSVFNGVAGISVGNYHTVFLKSDGSVWAVGGNNEHGQLGDGTTTQRTNPVQVMNADGTGFSGVVGISAGGHYTVYLKSDGTVWAAGRNDLGQLGDGTTTRRLNPVQVTNVDGSGLSGVLEISAGSGYTVYLKSDGTVWAAGYNAQGQLGDGTTTNRSNPVQVTNADGSGLSGVVGVSAANGHSVYLKSDGSVWAAGLNGNGQLGDGTTTQRTNPVQVTNVDGSGLSGVVGIFARNEHTVYLKSNGTVWAAGSNDNGRLGDGSTTSKSNPVQVTNVDGSGLSGVIGISAGSANTVYLINDGTVWATGQNTYGQLGDGTTTDRSNPVQVAAPSDLKEPFGQTNLKSISAGDYRTVYLKSDGTVWATGQNTYGQLGDGTTTDRSNPVQVTHADGTGLSEVVAVSAGDHHTVYLKSDGMVWATGSNGNGRLGDGTTTQRNHPVLVENVDGTGLSGVVGISAGQFHTVYLKSDGTVWAAGNNSKGQLGDGTTTQRKNPVQVTNADGSGLSGVVAISAGSEHTVYLKSDGTVWATGYNNRGQLGDGTTTQRTNPVQVTNADGTGLSGVADISAGGSHTVYLKSDGSVWATGYNAQYQFGNGTNSQRNNPVQVMNADGTGLSGVVGISSGDFHTVYLRSDGSVWATGYNLSGQLGDGTTIDRTYPVQVKNADGTGLSGVVDISAAYYHTVYLKSDGTVWAAGWNIYGELGAGIYTSRSNPVQVMNADGTGLSGVVGISGGEHYTVYLKSDGSVWAVGKNANGQLGDGTTTQRTNPVQVTHADGTGLSGVVGVSGGSNHTVYLKSDGTVWGAGYNYRGKLGDGTTTQRNNPVQVKHADGSGLSGVVAISAGALHTVYLKSDGTVWGAGYNTNGQLGDGTTTQRTNPVQVTKADGTSLSGVVGITAGYNHTVYLKSDGTVWAAGRNSNGQLGDGTTTQRTNPVQVLNGDGTGLSGVVGVSGGSNHTVYLKSDGTVWAAGRNSNGQLGDGTTTHRTNPVQVLNGDGTGLSGVVGISAGYYYTVYLKSDGTVWATGQNSKGQLGDFSNTDRKNPVYVSGYVEKLMDQSPASGSENQAPTDLNFTTALTIAENQPIGTIVGEYNATDPDGDAITYHFLNGDNNNSLFTLDTNGTLKTATTFDYESNASSYTITVQAKDEYNASVEGNFTVTLLDAYEDTDGDGFRDSLEASTGSDLNDANSTPLQQGLVAWYPFDGNASDMSGNGNDATPSSVFSYIDGIANKGIRIVGTDSTYIQSNSGHVMLPYLSVLESSDFTFSFWVKEEATYTEWGEVALAYGNLLNIDRTSGSGVKNNLYPFLTGNSYMSSLNLSNWSFLTVTRSHDQQTGYINGVSVGSNTINLNATYSSTQAAIGRHWWTGASSARYVGTFDEFRIYDRALSPEEITILKDTKSFYSPTNLDSIAALAFSENQPVGTIIGEFNATDPDGDAITYHFVNGENNNSLFTLETNGTLKTATTFDYETNASIYYIIVQAKDELNATVEGNFTVTLENLNEPPIITSGDTFSVQENGLIVAVVSASDPEEDTLYFNVGGEDGSKFQIYDDGTLSFIDWSDYENPTDANTDNEYVIEVTVRDPGDENLENVQSTVQTITIIVTDVYEPSQPNHIVDMNSTVNLEMIWVEPGTFSMGSPETETGRSTNETEHEVTLTKGFYLGKYEVTQAQYEAVMTGNTETDSDGNVISATPSDYSGNPDRPVEMISWDDIEVFLSRLNEQQADSLPVGWGYVLPTEAQWEYACRAGTTTAYSWGDSITTSDANYNNSVGQTTDVGQYSANLWGFFDMHGNVYEWTADAWGSYALGAQTDPFNSGAPGSYRVYRGGSYNFPGPDLRSASRSTTNPGNRWDRIGFRVGFQQVPDTVSPELELFGGTDVPHELGEPWAEPGYAASDDRDGNLTSSVTISGTPNINTSGTYTITYTVADAVGNEVNATRTVRVMPFIPYDPSALDANLTNLSNSGVTDVFVQGPVGQDLNISYSPTIPSGLNVTFHSDQDLYILKPFSYAGEQTVTLSAGGSIFVQASITASHTNGKLAALYGLSEPSVDNSHFFIVAQPINLEMGVNFFSQHGMGGEYKSYQVIYELNSSIQSQPNLDFALGIDINTSQVTGFSSLDKSNDFEGLGHKIGDNLGTNLFGSFSNGKIANLELRVQGEARAILANSITNARIVNVHLEGQISSIDRMEPASTPVYSNYMGAVAGASTDSKLFFCSANVTITGSSYIGGFLGSATGSEIHHSYVLGSVIGTLTGYYWAHRDYANEYTHFKPSNVGGFIGSAIFSSVINSYTNCAVLDDEIGSGQFEEVTDWRYDPELEWYGGELGGEYDYDYLDTFRALLGYQDSDTNIINSFGNSSHLFSPTGDQSKTESELKTKSTYTDAGGTLIRSGIFPMGSTQSLSGIMKTSHPPI